MDIVSTASAPEAIGPYSQAVKANGFVFCSGQIPMTVEGELVMGDVAEQAEQVLKNLQAVLAEAGASLDKVVKTTIFLADMNDFADFNEVYASFFGDHRPARATVEVSRLPKDVKVEIECVAMV